MANRFSIVGRWLTLLFSLVASGAFAQDASELVRQRAGQLCEALRSRNTEALVPLLADDCRVQGYDKEMGRKVLRAIAAQLTVDTLYATEVATRDCLTQVAARMHLAGEAKPCSFALDADGLFAEISLVKAVKRFENSLEPLSLAPCCELPFENRNGFIVLREGILIDGRSGVFVLDSGAKVTVLNNASSAATASVEGEGVMSRRGVVSSVTGSVKLVRVDSLMVGGSRFSLRGAAVDLSELARSLGLEELTGLIGADLLRAFETHIDYRKGVMRLYALDAEGMASGAPKPRKRIGFELLNGYLPLFDVAAGGCMLRMVFDTGAQRCCLTPASVERMGDAFRSRGNVQLRDADAATRVATGRIARLEWGGERHRKTDCVVRNLDAIGAIDGILGYPVVARRQVSLNFVRREFCFY